MWLFKGSKRVSQKKFFSWPIQYTLKGGGGRDIWDGHSKRREKGGGALIKRRNNNCVLYDGRDGGRGGLPF